MNTLQRFVGSHLGIVSRPGKVAFPPDEIEDGLVTAVSARIAPDEGATGRFSMGTGARLSESETACIGEAVERYSLSCSVPSHEAPTCSDDRQRPPEHFNRFHPAQFQDPDFPFAPVASGTRLAWVSGWDTRSGETVHLPAQMVLFEPHRFMTEDEPMFEQATSSGVAAGPNATFAAKRAIYELVERDAFMRTWLRRLRPIGFSWQHSTAIDEHSKHEVYRLMQRLRQVGATARLRWLDSRAGVPTILTAVRSNTVGVAVGCASDVDVNRAALNSLREALHGYNWAARLNRGSQSDKREVSAIESFEDHVAHHASPSMARHSDFLDSRAQEIPEVDGRSKSFSEVLHRLHLDGVRIYLVDVTAPEFAENVRVMRAISPDLVPLYASEAGRYLGCSTLYDDTVTAPNELNATPHPFP